MHSKINMGPSNIFLKFSSFIYSFYFLALMFLPLNILIIVQDILYFLLRFYFLQILGSSTVCLSFLMSCVF